MSDLVDTFKKKIPSMSAQDRADSLKVIEEQIAATMQNAQEAGENVGAGKTPGYVQAWASIVEKRRQDLAELEEVKRLLENGE